jgi:titin
LDFIEVNGATYDFEIVPPPVVAPSPVQVAATAGDKQAEITFSAGNNAGATVLAYEYQLGNEAWTSVGATVAPFTVAGLINGATYSLTMRTLSEGSGDEILASDASEPVKFVPVGLPLPPTNLSATVGDASAVVNFSNSDPNNGAAIINYHVSLDGGAFAPLTPADTSGPLAVTGLTNGQAHAIALKTQTSVGLSAASDSLTFTPVSGASPPDAPINVVLTPGDKQLSVSFTPGSDNGAAITNYAYQIDGGSWRALSPASTSTSFAITGLENGESYTISVRAINAEGSGANSVPVTATLPRPKVTIITDQNETIDLDITPENGSSCSVKTATLTPAPALESNVKSAYANMLDFTLTNCKPGETVGVAITLSQAPPENGIPYKYQGGEWRAIEGATITGKTIRYNLTDNGPLDADPTSGEINDPVAVAVPSGKPDAPYDLSATAGDSSATISFTPGNDQGNAITNYLYSTNGVDYTALDPADASSPITITGLTNGEGVSITLKARNSEGDSPASESIVIEPPVTTIPVPIPYWVLGLLAGLMGWMGFRRLSAA